MFRLFCDSNCELWHTTVKELGLTVIKMPYLIDDRLCYYDMGENTDFKSFFDKMREGTVPKTQALNEYDYLEYFEPVLQAGEDIYYITFSHKMSGTFEAMKSAIATLKEKYPDRVIRYRDTKTISLGAGSIVYYGALKWKEGASMDELDAYIDDLAEHTATYFVVEDLTYLYRGGRVSGVSKVVGNLLGIKPLLCFDQEGKIINFAKVKGFKNALSRLRAIMAEKGSELDKYKVWILQADNGKAADDFAASLKEQFGNIDVVVQPVGPVIGSHCGPGTIGLIFHCKEK